MMAGNIYPCDGIHGTLIMGVAQNRLSHGTLNFRKIAKPDLKRLEKKLCMTELERKPQVAAAH